MASAMTHVLSEIILRTFAIKTLSSELPHTRVNVITPQVSSATFSLKEEFDIVGDLASCRELDKKTARAGKKKLKKSNTLLISVIAERFIYRPHPFVLLKCDSILQILLCIRVFGQPWIEISCHHIIFFW